MKMFWIQTMVMAVQLSGYTESAEMCTLATVSEYSPSHHLGDLGRLASSLGTQRRKVRLMEAWGEPKESSGNFF